MEWQPGPGGHWAEAGVLNFFGVDGANPEARRQWEKDLDEAEQMGAQYENLLGNTQMDPSDAIAHVLTRGNTITDRAEIERRGRVFAMGFPEAADAVQPSAPNASSGSQPGGGAGPAAQQGMGSEEAGEVRPDNETAEGGMDAGATLPGGMRILPQPRSWLDKVRARTSRSMAEEAQRTAAAGNVPQTDIGMVAAGLKTEPGRGQVEAGLGQKRAVELAQIPEIGATERANIAAAASMANVKMEQEGATQRAAMEQEGATERANIEAAAGMERTKYASDSQLAGDLAKVGVTREELSLRYQTSNVDDQKALTQAASALSRISDKTTPADAKDLAQFIIMQSPAVQRLLGGDTGKAMEIVREDPGWLWRMLGYSGAIKGTRPVEDTGPQDTGPQAPTGTKLPPTSKESQDYIDELKLKQSGKGK